MSDNSHSNLVKENPLFQCFDSLVGRDKISSKEVDILKVMVLSCAERAEKILSQIANVFRQYTKHDLLHTLNVAERIADFLPRDPNNLLPLNALELALLWAAILLHDSGMAVTDEENKELLESDAYKNFLTYHRDRLAQKDLPESKATKHEQRKIEDALFAEFIRSRHPSRARKVIRKHFLDILQFQNKSLQDEVATLCESHGWNVPYSNIPNEPEKCVAQLPYQTGVAGCEVNLQYLACCLRLGDILDFDHTRAPEASLRYIGFTEEISWREWQKHLGVEALAITERQVTLHAKCDQPQQLIDIHTFLDWVDEEIVQCGDLTSEKPESIAGRYAFNLSPRVRRKVSMRDESYLAGGFRFQLEYEEIMELLMDKALYPDPALFLRELLQNSLDACRLQKALAEEQKVMYNFNIFVMDYSEDEKDPRIIFQDNGIGMSEEIVKNYFLRVGKSYYRSNDFNATRERLNAKGIQLDACSQFGIGFLSCFLGGDIIEVETYRLGAQPLTIRIQGPQKYFLIKRHNEPSGKLSPFFTGEDYTLDGPPNYPGTRVTVHLKEDWRDSSENRKNKKNFLGGVTAQTLKQYAVNVDVPITIRYYKSISKLENYSIKPRRWEEEEPLLPGRMKEFWRKYLCPVRISFEQYEETRDVRGGAWFWFLKGDNGKPSLRKGFCTIDISNNFNIDILAPTFSIAVTLVNLIKSKIITHDKVVKICTLNDDESKKELKKMLAELKFYIHEGIENISLLNKMERTDLLDTLTKIYDKDLDNWQTNYEQNEDLILYALNNDKDSVIKLLSDLEIIHPHFRFASIFKCALFGILLPVGWLDFNPLTGKSDNTNPFPYLCSKIDFWASATIKPSANRLNIPYERTSNIRQQIGYAILRTAQELIINNNYDVEWLKWIKGLIFNNDGLSSGLLYAWQKDECLPLKNDFIFYDANRNQITPSQVAKKFGPWVPFLDLEDGLLSSNYGNRVLELLPNRQGKNDCMEIDISVIFPELF
ncbi:MAG TPA: hypothetical protein VHY08_05495 [Bacillota bacterium]|nr:hypothetical protein [Bacillota bacterium]